VVSVAKDDVRRRCIHKTTASLATDYPLLNTPFGNSNSALVKGYGVVSAQQLDQFS
jgi:hypothetical protein